ncbi:MAG: putative bifunctional diguanylate cyclase/phosphodiesterase [Cyanobacteriota bacterium]
MRKRLRLRQNRSLSGPNRSQRDSSGSPSGSSGRDFLRLQQELVAVRTRFDRQIGQLNRLNRLSNTVLAQHVCQGLGLFAEAIPDVLDMAIGVVWSITEGSVQDSGVCGLELNPDDLRAVGLGLQSRLRSAARQRGALRLEPVGIPLLERLALTDVLACRCIDSAGHDIGLVMAANTITLAGMFDPISEETPAVLTQVAERLASHLEARRARTLLDERLAQLKESEERLQRVLRGTNDGWWDFDLPSNRCLVSSRWIEMLGGHPADLRTRPGFWLDRIHPSEREAFGCRLRELLASARHSTLEQELTLLRDDGSSLPVLLRGTAFRNGTGQAIRFSGSILDLTERKQHEAHVHRLAYTDALTDLPNRRGLVEQLPRMIGRCDATGQRLAVLMIDLDGFKKLNDSHGHAAGDQMLTIVAERLRQRMRQRDLVARLGGDEFLVVLDALGPDFAAAQAAAHRVAETLVELLSRPYGLEVGLSFHSASIGVAVLGEGSDTAAALMQQADVALYEAKGAGRSRAKVFDPAMQLELNQRVWIEQQLRTSLQNDQHLSLHYQGIVDGDGRICGAEALMRWHHPELACSSPAGFMAVAEESGLIHQLGDWSVLQIAETLRSWQRELTADFRIAINLSASQFLHPDFVARTLDWLGQHQISGERLMLEISEAMVLEDLDLVVQRTHRLRQEGLHFSLDDFGTGFSSISYLRQLPLAEVKIDKIYVQNFLHDASDRAVVRALLGLCHALGISVVAEGVETEEQWQGLRAEGCDRFQGFLFSVPGEAGAQPEALLHGRWRCRTLPGPGAAALGRPDPAP